MNDSSILNSGPLVVWQDENKDPQIGFMMMYEGGVFTKFGGIRSLESMYRQSVEEVMVRHSKKVTAKEHIVLEFVPFKDIFHYYDNKQPEGMTPHHVSYSRYTESELSNLCMLHNATRIKEDIEIAVVTNAVNGSGY